MSAPSLAMDLLALLRFTVQLSPFSTSPHSRPLLAASSSQLAISSRGQRVSQQRKVEVADCKGRCFRQAIARRILL